MCPCTPTQEVLCAFCTAPSILVRMASLQNMPKLTCSSENTHWYYDNFENHKIKIWMTLTVSTKHIQNTMIDVQYAFIITVFMIIHVEWPTCVASTISQYQNGKLYWILMQQDWLWWRLCKAELKNTKSFSQITTKCIVLPSVKDTVVWAKRRVSSL